MATNYADTVNAFYLAYYGRPADPAGLAFWSQALQQSNGDFSALVSAFSTSSEATGRFGSESVADRVTDIYQQLFSRAPDKAGLDYWTGQIESGHLSMGSAAIAIMGGAQTSDAQISTAREQAAAQFTTAVAASGVAYDGIAAIEAARVLISAVNADSKPADITALVQASTSLVQTAHDNPAIISALANGGDLSTLLSSASGKADPVGMVQALATLGKAALTDSAGLTSLLNGGGVAGLLDSLPAGTSLKDVAAAVQQGGLAAGTDVANPPPVATAPAITPTIAFVGTDGHDLPAGTTLAANSIWYFIDVKGIPSHGSTDFQVSATGTGGWTSTSEDTTLPDGTYFVRYVVTDAAGNSGTSNTLKLVMDHTIAYPTVQLVRDTGNSSADYLTNDGTVKVSGLHANETWTYSFDGQHWTAGTTDANGNGTIAAPTTDGAETLQIRTLENVAGNSQFTSTAFHYTVDTTAPAQGLALASVQGAAAGSTHSSLTHADVVFNYTGTLDTTNGEALFYQIGSSGWLRADGTIVDTVHKTVTFQNVDLSHGDVPIVLEAKDAAGNLTDLNVTISGPADTTPPAAPTVALVQDTGVSATDHITTNGSVQVSGIESGGSWDYSFDGHTWTAGPAADGNGVALLATSPAGSDTLQVRSHDAAGNTSDVSTLQYTYEPTLQAGLTFAANNGVHLVTNTAQLSAQAFSFDLHGHLNDVSASYQISTTGNAGDFAAWTPGTHLDDGTYFINATVTDPAGNSVTTGAVSVTIDTQAPAVPTVALTNDTGASATDGITYNPTYTVSGIEAGATWEYSLDGQHWLQGSAADGSGTATGFLVDGEQTVQVRVQDAAGNVSGIASLHATLDNIAPAAGLAFDHITGGATGVSTTTLTQVDATFTYTGTIGSSDTVEYTHDGTTWTPVDNSMIDPVAKTITFHDIDLSTSDQWFQVRATSVAGLITTSHWLDIDGPYTQYSVTQMTDTGIALSSQQAAHVYLTDNGNTVQIQTTDASGDAVQYQQVTIGVQATAASGVLGVGPSAVTHTDNGISYGFGTTGADTLAGQNVWGYGGDDNITVTGSAAYNSGYVVGGAGSDTIHTETSSSQLMYTGVQDSFVAADGAPAHGFDTVYISADPSVHLTEVFNFENVQLDDGYRLSLPNGTPYTGNETGNDLLSLLNAAVAPSFRAGDIAQSALIDCGPGSDGKDVNFLVIDTDGNGTIDASDYVVKIVGTIDTGNAHGTGWGYHTGMFTIQTGTSAP